jgi:hypothetical protein
MANDLYDRLTRDLFTAKNTGENYKDAKENLWNMVQADSPRYLEMFFNNWFNNNWARGEVVKPYKPRKPQTPAQVKERRKSDANLRGLALMNMFLSDGETRLKDATGRQVRAETGWLQLIAKHVKPNEIVGKKLTAEQLANLKIQSEPRKAA